MRNEAHRFAVTYQRKRRKKKTLRSELLDIEGIGPKTAQTLLQHFGSVARVKEAGADALAEVVGPAKAERVARYFAEGKAAEGEAPSQAPSQRRASRRASAEGGGRRGQGPRDGAWPPRRMA